MSTKSNIAMKNKDGTYSAIYCHYDGNPGYMFPTLKEHYSKPRTVKKLISLGALSSLENNPYDPPKDLKHSFDNRIEGYCIAYARDRGDCDVHIMQFESLSNLLNDFENDYLYVFENGNWTWYSYDETKLINKLNHIEEILDNE